MHLQNKNSISAHINIISTYWQHKYKQQLYLCCQYAFQNNYHLFSPLDKAAVPKILVVNSNNLKYANFNSNY